MFDTNMARVDMTQSGMIRKTHEHSYIIRFHLESPYAKSIFKRDLVSKRGNE